MTGNPWSPATLERLEGLSENDLSFIHIALEGERLFALDKCSNPINSCAEDLAVLVELKLWHQIVEDALGSNCEELLQTHTLIEGFFSSKPDFLSRQTTVAACAVSWAFTR